MTWYFKYIRPSDLAAHKRRGWKYVGKMRPDNWASPNHDSIIVRKKVPNT